MAINFANTTALRQYGYIFCSPKALFVTGFKIEIKPSILHSQVGCSRKPWREIPRMHLKTSEPPKNRKISTLECHLHKRSLITQIIWELKPLNTKIKLITEYVLPLENRRSFSKYYLCFSHRQVSNSRHPNSQSGQLPHTWDLEFVLALKKNRRFSF
jgi:hypothetical protein